MNSELQFLIYNTTQFNTKINVVVKDETIWLTQKAMFELFDVKVPAISKNLKNIFEEGELDEKLVTIMETTTQQLYDRWFKTLHIVSDFDKEINILQLKGGYSE